jgi:teichoic acid transport system ATP-binding protein
MPGHERKSPARLLAPTALALFALAVAVVIMTSNASDEAGGRDAASERTSAREPATNRRGPRRERATYTVKIGDTLGAIAEQTGVSVERLQELNPDLDPQALVSGQRIKLRE